MCSWYSPFSVVHLWLQWEQLWSYLHLDDSGVTFYCWCPDNCYLAWHTACCKIASPCVGEGEANLRCVCVIAVKWGVSVCADLYHLLAGECDTLAIPEPAFCQIKRAKLSFATRSQVIAWLVDGSLFRCLWASLNVLLQFVGRSRFYFCKCVLCAFESLLFCVIELHLRHLYTAAEWSHAQEALKRRGINH